MAVKPLRSTPTTAWIPTRQRADRGDVNIGAAMPLSGGVAAAAFAPVAAGFKAYIEYANANGLVPGYESTLTIGDDQYNPSLTPNV